MLGLLGSPRLLLRAASVCILGGRLLRSRATLAHLLHDLGTALVVIRVLGAFLLQIGYSCATLLAFFIFLELLARRCRFGVSHLLDGLRGLL